ncbi:uncharacterized protein LOC106995115 [Macaca mulatta]
MPRPPLDATELTRDSCSQHVSCSEARRASTCHPALSTCPSHSSAAEGTSVKMMRWQPHFSSLVLKAKPAASSAAGDSCFLSFCVPTASPDTQPGRERSQPDHAAIRRGCHFLLASGMHSSQPGTRCPALPCPTVEVSGSPRAWVEGLRACQGRPRLWTGCVTAAADGP